MAFHDPEEVVDFMYELFTSHSGDLGIKYVAYGDESLLPQYPALQLTSGIFHREIIATHKFALEFNVEMWLYHANLNESHRERTRTDMLLATAVKDLLDINATLDDNIIFGFVDGETPGVMSRTVGGKSTAVVTTRISWRGEGRQTFQ